MLEIWNTPFETKDIDTTGRQVEMYLSAYGNVDSHDDIMQKGAFAKTIKDTKNKYLLWNHDMSQMPCGIFDTKEFREDEFGLRAIATINKTRLGEDLLECYKTGAIQEHSVGFYTLQKKNNDAGNRIITEVKLVEGSAVLQASNPNTPFLGLKSANPADQMAELEKRSQRLYKLLSAGNISDETGEQFAIEHALLIKAIAEISTSLRVKEPEIISTPEIIEEPKEIKSIDVYAEFMKAYKK